MSPHAGLEEGTMRELTGKMAFATGWASGIGLALGRAFAEAGMKVTLADGAPRENIWNSMFQWFQN
jgi:NADP-dependent 3-hydroxy acid dehydrogenase YdfG